MKTARDIIDSTFRAMYRDARTLDYEAVFGMNAPVTTDPFAALTWPRKIRKEPDPFTEDERDRICDYFREKDRYWFPFVFTRFWTGLRPAEARALRYGDLDLRRGKLSVHRSRTLREDNPTKTMKAERSIRLHSRVVAVLRDMPKPAHLTDGDFVFVTPAQNDLDEDRFIAQHWHRALRALGLRHRPFKTTRHTFISIALTHGANLKKLADYCGTSVAMIEQHYGKWLGDDDDFLAVLGDGERPSQRRPDRTVNRTVEAKAPEASPSARESRRTRSGGGEIRTPEGFRPWRFSRPLP